MEEKEETINISHDGVVSIATGNSRKEMKWNNCQVKWSELVKRVSKTTYTYETVAEYKAMVKFAAEDERVKVTLGREKLNSIITDFDIIDNRQNEKIQLKEILIERRKY